MAIQEILRRHRPTDAGDQVPQECLAKLCASERHIDHGGGQQVHTSLNRLSSNARKCATRLRPKCATCCAS